MKNLIILLFCILVFQITLQSQTFNCNISDEAFKVRNRFDIENFPADKLPKGIEQLYITVYDGGGATVLHGKCKEAYVLIDSLETGFMYNEAKEFGVFYKNGLIEVISQMPFSAAESIAIFKFENNRLIFIRDSMFSPNDQVYADIDLALKQGNIKEAAELYLGIQYPHLGLLENAQLTLLERAHEIATQYSKNKDYNKAAETMGYAYDFYDGINEETDIEANSNYAKYIADYTFFLMKVPDYNKCINVCRVINSLSPEMAGPYLHLGNSLYETEQKEEAHKAYEKYVEIRKSKNEQNRIPDYVYKRLNAFKN